MFLKIGVFEITCDLNIEVISVYLLIPSSSKYLFKGLKANSKASDF